MGLLSYFNPSPTEVRAEAVRSGAAVPSREERARCWESRDAYFSCLDGASIIDPLADPSAAKRACGAQSNQFEKDCAAQWVSRDPRRDVVVARSGIGSWKYRERTRY